MALWMHMHLISFLLIHLLSTASQSTTCSRDGTNCCRLGGSITDDQLQSLREATSGAAAFRTNQSQTCSQSISTTNHVPPQWMTTDSKSQCFRSRSISKKISRNCSSSEAVLNCPLCGTPPLTVTYYRLNARMPRGARCSLSYCGSKSTSKEFMPHFPLILNYTLPDMSINGWYVLVANNSKNEMLVGIFCVRVFKGFFDPEPSACLSNINIDIGPEATITVPDISTKNVGSLIGIIVGCVIGGVVILRLLAIIINKSMQKLRTRDSPVFRAYNRFQDENNRHPGSVYVSYACDSDSHREKVRALVARIRTEHSIDCCVYDYHEDEARERFVFNWVAEKIQSAAKIIVVCSPEYHRITELYTDSDPRSDEDSTVGENVRRTRAEWRFIRSRIFSEALNCCIPVVFEELREVTCLPLDMAGAIPLCWPQEENDLVKRLDSCIPIVR